MVVMISGTLRTVVQPERLHEFVQGLLREAEPPMGIWTRATANVPGAGEPQLPGPHGPATAEQVEGLALLLWQYLLTGNDGKPTLLAREVAALLAKPEVATRRIVECLRHHVVEGL